MLTWAVCWMTKKTLERMTKIEVDGAVILFAIIGDVLIAWAVAFAVRG